MMDRFTGWKLVPRARDGGDEKCLGRFDNMGKRDRPNVFIDLAQFLRDWFGTRGGCE